MIQNHNIHTIPQPSAVLYWNMKKDTSKEIKETLLNMLYISLTEEERSTANVDVMSQVVEDLPPYTLEELQSRSDEAYAELEAGGGKDGDEFFAELNDYVMSR